METHIQKQLWANKTVYLSGPMSGLPELNFAAFHRVAQILREEGVVVLNPAETFGGNKDLHRSKYFRHDFAVIAAVCDAMVMLPGWTNSMGAKGEIVAAHLCGLSIFQAVIDPVPGDIDDIFFELKRVYVHDVPDITVRSNPL